MMQPSGKIHLQCLRPRSNGLTAQLSRDFLYLQEKLTTNTENLIPRPGNDQLLVKLETRPAANQVAD